MKSVLISIQPKWCDLIASGQKTIEVRKTKPKLQKPFKVYIYCTKGTNRAFSYDTFGINGKPTECGGKVIGEFICNRMTSTALWRLRGKTGRCAKRTEIEEKFPVLSCLSLDEIREYAGSNQRIVYGWHISDLKIYDRPKELCEFYAFKKCDSCKVSGYECSACIYDEDCIVPAVVTKPPQSWCYVEELP